MLMEPGRILAHYRLLAKLGEGGMGVVWKALDTDLEREVAIKVLPDALSADEARLARFQREAKLLASLNHPNIATVYGLHQQEGVRFLAMELIQGEDLARAMSRRSLEVTEALSVAAQIAAALEATHERGVVHRDLKPANIFLTRGGEVKVLDFGIATQLEAPSGDDVESANTPARTEPGTILGTVAYMSPEQARAKPLDERTDLWAFGCVLYEMLAGRAAFRGETRWDKLAAVLREEPDWTALPEAVPDAVRELLRRCLAKSADARLADAGEARRVVESALATFTSPRGVPAAPEPTPAERRPRRSRARVAAAAVVVLAVVLAGLWALRNRPPAAPTTDRRSVAVLPFESMGGGDDNASFTAGIHDDVLNHIAKIGDLKVISRTSVMEYRSSSKNLRQIAQELGVATVLEGTVHRAGDEVRINVQLIDALADETLWAESYQRELTTEGIFSIQTDIAERIADALEATLSVEERQRIDERPTADMAAYDAYLQATDYLNRPGFEAQNLLASRRMFEQAVARDPSFALAYAGLSAAARYHYWMGGGGDDALQEAETAAEQALALAPDLPEAHLAKGAYLYVRRDYEGALEELRIAEHGLPGDAELIRSKAFIVRRLNQWPAALQELRRAQALDPRDPASAVEIGFTLACMRRYDEAAPQLERALALAPDYPSARVFLALLPLLRDGTPETALAAADSIEREPHNPWTYAHGWQAALFTRDYARVLRFLDGRERISAQWYAYPPALLRGWTHLLQGQEGAARGEFETARATLESDVRNAPDDARLHGALGVAYAGLGRPEDALRSGRRAVELLPIEKDVFVGAWQMQDLAWILVMVGQPEAAVEALDRVLSVPSLFSIEALQLDPRADPLRGHPGFEALIAKHGRGRPAAEVPSP